MFKCRELHRWQITWRGEASSGGGGLASEAVPRLALPDGLVESLTEGEVSLALGALHKLTALRREQNKSQSTYIYRVQSMQCLASSVLLTPHPLPTQRVCSPPPPPPKVEGGAGGQYLGRRQTMDWPLTVYSLYGISLQVPFSLPVFPVWIRQDPWLIGVDPYYLTENSEEIQTKHTMVRF